MDSSHVTNHGEIVRRKKVVFRLLEGSYICGAWVGSNLTQLDPSSSSTSCLRCCSITVSKVSLVK